MVDEAVGFGWSGAREAVEEHCAHIFLIPMGDRTPSPEFARAFTFLVAGFTEAMPEVLAVNWHSSNQLASPEMMQQAAETLARGDVPLRLWVMPRQIPPAPGAGTPGILTSGLCAVVGREIEFDPGSMRWELAKDRVLGLALYLCREGPVIGDGDTIGVSRTERIRVRHAMSRVEKDWPVYRVTPEG
jgi:hypothetical protein